MELSVVSAFLWLPGAYYGVLDRYLPGVSQSGWTGIAQVFGSFAGAGLIIYLFWNNFEPLQRIGIVRPGVSDIPRGAFLFAALIALRFATVAIVVRLGSDVWLHRSGWPFAEGAALAAAAFRAELFYRGYLHARITDLGGNQLVFVVVSAAMSSLPHLYDGWPFMPGHFCFAVLISLAFLQFRSIWPLAAAHALINLTPL